MTVTVVHKTSLFTKETGYNLSSPRRRNSSLQSATGLVSHASSLLFTSLDSRNPKKSSSWTHTYTWYVHRRSKSDETTRTDVVRETSGDGWGEEESPFTMSVDRRRDKLLKEVPTNDPYPQLIVGSGLPSTTYVRGPRGRNMGTFEGEEP